MEKDSVITRFAPSPTGYIHIGNVRSALFPWLLARQTGGKLILRIEDTDQARFVEGATEMIMDTLQWLGLQWDEGPIVGGNNGPYFQTERQAIYHQWAQKLIDKGLAYPDPYTSEQVDEFRAEARALKRPFLFRNYRPETFDSWDGKTALRFKVPEIKRYSWHDPVMGDLSAGEDALDDFILIKADGLPTYNFAHIVDDAEMGVTHVIRGAEYIASTPKYLSLYEALELKPPVLVCLPHILAPNGNKKLGKRDGAKSVSEYRKDGILPETMINFLASLGWNDGTTQEIFSINELIEKFSLDRVQKSGARFDEKRLLWMNNQWIKRLSIDDLLTRVADFWGENGKKADRVYQKQVLTLAQERLKTLADLPNLTEYFFAEPKINWQLVDNDKQLSKLSREQHRDLLALAIKHLQTSKYDEDSLQNTLNQILEESGLKPNITFSIIRFALTWAPFSPNLNQMMSVLGQKTVLNRLKLALKS
ncbi:MAG: glutamate--tRNA ligase [Candidatus Saccharibacteria bacterium]|nr:glutamate--tRNA ligase [Candidatus Saccharibacteria bacterium]